MIDPQYYGLVEIIVGAVIVLGIGFWQLWGLRKLERERKAAEREGRREDE